MGVDELSKLKWREQKAVLSLHFSEGQIAVEAAPTAHGLSHML